MWIVATLVESYIKEADSKPKLMIYRWSPNEHYVFPVSSKDDLEIDVLNAMLKIFGGVASGRDAEISLFINEDIIESMRLTDAATFTRMHRITVKEIIQEKPLILLADPDRNNVETKFLKDRKNELERCIQDTLKNMECKNLFELVKKLMENLI